MAFLEDARVALALLVTGFQTYTIGAFYILLEIMQTEIEFGSNF